MWPSLRAINETFRTLPHRRPLSAANVTVLGVPHVITKSISDL